MVFMCALRTCKRIGLRQQLLTYTSSCESQRFALRKRWKGSGLKTWQEVLMRACKGIDTGSLNLHADTVRRGPHTSQTWQRL